MFRKIGFIGLGLMGGSLAKSIKKYHKAFIVAYDLKTDELNQALNDNVIDKISCSIEEDFTDLDIVFLCAPVKVNISLLEKLDTIINKDCIITDIGSTKIDILTQSKKVCPDKIFIGGHPMTGSEKSGYDVSSSELFENIYYLLVSESAHNNMHLDKMYEFVKSIDSIPLVMGAVTHDRACAAISHVPHIVASALVNSVKKQDDGHATMHTLAAGGFRDITRLASGSPEMWESILLTNKESILSSLNSYKKEIDYAYDIISSSDSKKIFDMFSNAKNYRDSFSERNSKLIPETHRITIDVEDTPGIIAKISTILFENNINIKNIGIVNNRENDEGVLEIHFGDENSYKKSIKILNTLNFIVHR